MKILNFDYFLFFYFFFTLYVIIILGFYILILKRKLRNLELEYKDLVEHSEIDEEIIEELSVEEEEGK